MKYSKLKKYYKYYLFILPAGIIILVFILFPAILSLGLSFFEFSIFKSASFCGWTNYQKLISDPILRQTYFNVIVNWCIRIFGVVIIPLIIAILLYSINQGKKFFRTIYFLPVIISVVSSSIIWKWMYEPGLSIINYYLEQVGLRPINWLGSPNFSMVSVSIMTIWVWWGFNLVIYIAGLNAIPKDLYDAAKVDGANDWQKFVYVTFPQLKPIILFVVIIDTIRCFQLFEEPFCLTKGAPLNRTLTPVMYIYKQGFEYYNLGYASTIAVSLFFILMFISIFQVKLMEEKGKEY